MSTEFRRFDLRLHGRHEDCVVREAGHLTFDVGCIHGLATSMENLNAI
jgi:hypothetical protein